jgi:predicted kinase
MIHLILGNTGAGKTTYAQELKKKVQGVIFSVDHWNNTLFMADKQLTDGVDWFLERIARGDTMIRSLVKQLEEAGVDSILDLGFAKEERRANFCNFAKANSFNYQLHFLDIPKEIRRQRVVQRNTNKGDTFQFEVSNADFEFMETWFERPTDKELVGANLITV